MIQWIDSRRTHSNIEHNSFSKELNYTLFHSWNFARNISQRRRARECTRFKSERLFFSYFRGIFWLTLPLSVQIRYNGRIHMYSVTTREKYFAADFLYMKSTSAFNCPNESTFWHTTLAQPSRSHTLTHWSVLHFSYTRTYSTENSTMARSYKWLLWVKWICGWGVFKPFSRILTGCESPEKKTRRMFAAENPQHWVWFVPVELTETRNVVISIELRKSERLEWD